MTFFPVAKFDVQMWEIFSQRFVESVLIQIQKSWELKLIEQLTETFTEEKNLSCFAQNANNPWAMFWPKRNRR